MTRRVALALAAAAALAIAADAPRADLTLKDAAGRKVRLRDLRGKPVVLNFWASWCGPCKDEMPLLAALEKQYAARGVVVRAASLDENKSKAAAFVQAHAIETAVWYGATADDLDRLKLGNAVPATAFLDAEGHIVARILGEARETELRERLDWLTGQSAAPPEPLVNHLPER